MVVLGGGGIGVMMFEVYPKVEAELGACIMYYLWT